MQSAPDWGAARHGHVLWSRREGLSRHSFGAVGLQPQAYKRWLSERGIQRHRYNSAANKHGSR
jgi:hypothetical protein